MFEGNTNEPTSDYVKEVYARFGLAYHHAEVLHWGLCNLFLHTQLPANGRITPLRVEHLKFAEETTLGQLLPKFEAILPQALFEKLKQAAERRNFLAHYFWYEGIHLMGSKTGIDTLLAELAKDTELFSEADAEIEKISYPLRAKLGINEELFERLMAETRGGMPIEPHIQRRKLKKEETIIGAFRAKTTGEYYALKSQTEDGELWQLCDAGLGWTFYDKPGTSWAVDEKLSSFLPAKVNPRPKITAPWNYDLQFGSNGALSVRPGELPGQILYRLKPFDRKSGGKLAQKGSLETARPEAIK